MNDEKQAPSMGRFGPPPSVHAAPPDEVIQAMRRAAAEVMAIQDVTLGDVRSPIRIRGTLTLPSEEAFQRLRPQFEAVGHTPLLRREEGLDVLRALPTVFGKERSGPPRVTIILLVLTILSVFWIGMFQSDALFINPLEAIAAQITGNVSAVAQAFGDPVLPQHPELLPTPQAWRETLQTGLLYALALLGILGTHEMGHYLMSRHHKVKATLPFFIPLPFQPLGTLGAVILMREPAPNRRVQFDIGIAGPLAGLIVAVPVLIWGLSLSHVSTQQQILAATPAAIRDRVAFTQEGNSLAYLAIKYLMFGEILPSGNRDVFVHAVAFAGWAGFLVTALNLLPIGQLDGGHVIYGLLGEKSRLLRWPVIGALAVLATVGTLNDMGLTNLSFGWSGWWIWVALSVLLLRSHAPVLDEITGLDGKRKVLGAAMLVVFILLFTPAPLVINETPLAALLRGIFV